MCPARLPLKFRLAFFAVKASLRILCHMIWCQPIIYSRSPAQRHTSNIVHICCCPCSLISTPITDCRMLMPQVVETGTGCTSSRPGSPVGLDQPQPLAPHTTSPPGSSTAAAVSRDKAAASRSPSLASAQQNDKSGSVSDSRIPGCPASARVSQDESLGDLEGGVHAAAQQVVRSGANPNQGMPGFPAAAHAQPCHPQRVDSEVSTGVDSEGLQARPLPSAQRAGASSGSRLTSHIRAALMKKTSATGASKITASRAKKIQAVLRWAERNTKLTEKSADALRLKRNIAALDAQVICLSYSICLHVQVCMLHASITHTMQSC